MIRSRSSLVTSWSVGVWILSLLGRSLRPSWTFAERPGLRSRLSPASEPIVSKSLLLEQADRLRQYPYRTTRSVPLERSTSGSAESLPTWSRQDSEPSHYLTDSGGAAARQLTRKPGFRPIGSTLIPALEASLGYELPRLASSGPVDRSST